jgi:hypothetical protein
MSEHPTTLTGQEQGHGPSFTEAEMEAFRKSDIGAGAAVIVLMTAIFGVGLVLYVAIAFIVAA